MLTFRTDEYESVAVVFAALEPVAHGDITGIGEEFECAGDRTRFASGPFGSALKRTARLGRTVPAARSIRSTRSSMARVRRSSRLFGSAEAFALRRSAKALAER